MKEVGKRKTHSERRACRVVGVSRSTARYEPVPESEANRELRRRMKELAGKRKRFGYRRIHAILVREGQRVIGVFSTSVYDMIFYGCYHIR